MKPTILRFLAALPLATTVAWPAAAAPRTFCNPLDLDYGWSAEGFRHGADAVVVLFKHRYYLQYATPGTVTEWYCDTVLVGGSPSGPVQMLFQGLLPKANSCSN